MIRGSYLVGLHISRPLQLLVVLSFNLLGNWLHDTLNPNLRTL